jgi:hypothetical protein
MSALRCDGRGYNLAVADDLEKLVNAITSRLQLASESAALPGWPPLGGHW